MAGGKYKGMGTEKACFLVPIYLLFGNQVSEQLITCRLPCLPFVARTTTRARSSPCYKGGKLPEYK